MDIPKAPSHTLQEIQAQVDGFISQFKEGYWPPLASLARLTEEVGELAREVNHRFGPKQKRAEEGEKALEEELGDVLFILTSLTNSLGLSLDECFNASLQKVQKRDAQRFARVSSDSAAAPAPHTP